MSGHNRTSRGLSAYARLNRVRPLFGFMTLLEGLLSLLGVMVLILWLMSGSFENAGSALDHFFALLYGPLHRILGFIGQ